MATSAVARHPTTRRHGQNARATLPRSAGRGVWSLFDKHLAGFTRPIGVMVKQGRTGKECRMSRFGLAFVVALSVVAMFAIGTGLLACRHYHVYSFNGWHVYQAMQKECHPVWEDYNFGRVRAGDDVEQTIARTKPAIIERKGRWVELKYQSAGFTGVSAAAYDGKIVFAGAWSCTWTRVFFDELTDEQSMEYLGHTRSDPRRFGIVPVFRS
jgi:hypothetical protein